VFAMRMMIEMNLVETVSEAAVYNGSAEIEDR
jgi:hypothetical protein